MDRAVLCDIIKTRLSPPDDGSLEAIADKVEEVMKTVLSSRTSPRFGPKTILSLALTAARAEYSDKEGCRCQGCGAKYKIDVMVDDKTWEEIKPKGKPKGAGLLCGSCIFEMMERTSDFAAYELKDLKG